MSAQDSTFDAVVIGAGFGGLAAALTLAERGSRVCLIESLNYPGGCASTFRREGYRFESGATLFSGFGEGQLFRALIDRHALDVTVDFLDPVVTLRAPGLDLAIPPTREALMSRLLALPGAPRDQLASFFARQRKVADLLWDILDDPALLPPFTAKALLRHAARAPRYLSLVPLLGQPLFRVLESHGLTSFTPLTLFLDALCQITLQCSAREAEAPFALATMDYYFRGTGHVRGGIGQLAWSLSRAIERLGGEVRYTSAARRIERAGPDYIVHTRRGPLRARAVLSNLLPQTTATLLEAGGTPAPPSLAALTRKVETGWGACMLYIAAPPPSGLEGPCHIELIQDPTAPLTSGNHLFCSMSGPHEEGRAPPGLRTMTVSTHVDMPSLRALPAPERASRIARIQATMRAGLDRFLPDLLPGAARVMTASPRTFERFTGRPMGYVGGVPRRAGLDNYERILPTEILPRLYLVGDSVFPGQSTLAVALSGIKAAERLARN
ncbi:MAG: NAD(P)/FAD-dependent oxidoreductase [Polyangiaceae bacterium]